MDDDIDARDDTKRKSRNLSEKKRRDQFNMLVNELGSMVNSNTRKMDKSTVLKSTILFLKNHNEIAVRSRAHEIQEDWKPSFLTNEEFIRLILEALDGFIMVFSSNGRIHYASESVTSLLGYLPSELANATIYEIAYQEDQSHLYNVLLNPTTGRKDQQHRIGKKRNSEQRVRRGSKVYTIMAKRRREVASETEKEELADEESAEAGDYIIKEDADSEDGEPNVIETNEIDCNEKQLPVNSSTGSNENQVSFTCHIKRGGLDFREEPIYELVQFIGYFRSDVDADVEGLIPNNKLGSTTSGTDNRKMVFVGTGRLQTPQIIREMSVVDSNKSEFTSRHSLEWKFLFLDHRAPPIIGYLPFEVLGTSGYDYYHVDDLDKVVTCHESLMQKGEGTSCHYRFLTKGQQWIWLQTRFYITYNQWNSKPEFIVCTHRVVSYVDVVKELRKNSETLSKSQSQETTSPSTGEQPQVGTSSQMPTSTWSSKSQTQETTSPSTGEHQQVGISSQMPTSTWSSKSSSKASRFVTSFSSRMRHHGGSDTGSISVSSQSSRKSLPVLPSVRHNDSHNECMSPGTAISHKSASAHERTRNPMEPLQPRRQEHQHQQHQQQQQQQQQQQHHQQPQQEYRQVEMSHETSTTFTEPNQYAGEVSIPSAVSASGYSTPNQSMIPTLLTTEMLHQQGIIMTPAQNHIQDELQRKHEELQQLIVHQQEELRRVSEQLLIARYGILSPLLNVGIPAYNSTNPCQQPNPCNNGTTGMRNQIQGMGVGVGMTSTPTTTSAVQEVSILPVPITLPVPIVPTELFPQSMSPMSANVTGNVVGRTTLEPSSQSPVHQQRQPPPTHQENNNELINFPMCPQQNEIVYTNVPQQQIPTSQHQRPTRN